MIAALGHCDTGGALVTIFVTMVVTVFILSILARGAE